MSARQKDWNVRGLRWPEWLYKYESWHPLHSTGYDVYKEEALARDARRYKSARAVLVAAYQNLERFEDARLPQRARVAAGERAADQFTEAHHLARERRAELEGRLLGDHAFAAVLVNDQPTGALIAPRFLRTIIDRQMARRFGLRSTGRRGSIVYRGRLLRGHYASAIVTCDARSAAVSAFVPRRRFATGILVGKDWVERAGAEVNGGELVASKQISLRHRARGRTLRVNNEERR